mgnify:CR=1 FL=1
MSKHTIEFKSIPFEPGHAEDLIGQVAVTEAENKYLRSALLGKIPVNSAPHPAARHAVSVIRNGHLIGAGGIYPVWDGLGEAWVLPSEQVARYKKSFVRLIREGIDRMTAEFEFRRVQATARADAQTAQRFLEFLGFEREGLLRAYGPDGADHVLFAKLTGR